MKLLTVLFTMIISTAYACPELNEVDLANGEGPWTHIELEAIDIYLSQAEFDKIPGLEGMYKDCKDHLSATKVQDITTGKYFTAVKTNADECDGGNAYGALFNNDMTKILGDIKDSFISCY